MRARGRTEYALGLLSIYIFYSNIYDSDVDDECLGGMTSFLSRKKLSSWRGVVLLITETRHHTSKSFKLNYNK